MKRQDYLRLIPAFYIPSALIAVAYALLTPTLPIYAGELTDAFLVIGIILAAEGIGNLFGDLPSSSLLRRYGTKPVMLGGLWLALLPMLALFFVESVWLTVLLLFLSGIGHAFYNISRHAYIALVIPNNVRGRAIGLLGGVFRAGKFIGPVLGGWVGGTFGLQYAFLTFAVVALGTIFFVWRFMLQHDLNIEDSEQPQPTHPPLLQILRDHSYVFATAGLGQVLAQLTRRGWLVLMPLYAAENLGMDVGTIGLVLSISSGFDLMFFFASGIIMDRFGRKWAVVPSFVMQGCGVALLFFVDSAVTLTAVGAFIGFANGLSSGTMMTLGADFAPPDMRGEFLSVWRLIGDIGFLTAPMVIGTIAQVLALQISIFAIAGSGFGAALLFGLFVPETLRHKHKRTTSQAGD